MENLKINYEEKKEVETTIEIPCYLTDGKNKFAFIADESKAIVINNEKWYASVSDVWLAKDVLSQGITQHSDKGAFEFAFGEVTEKFYKLLKTGNENKKV